MSESGTPYLPRGWEVMLVATLMLGAGCTGDNTPCSTCAPVEGQYALTFEIDTLPAECTALGIGLPAGDLVIARVGSSLAGTLGPWNDLRGTLNTTDGFTLSDLTGPADGGTSSDSVSLRGQYLRTGRDGGSGGLSGTYSASHPRGTRTCAIDRVFSGSRR